MRISCTVNGEPQRADDVWEGESLLYVLRERLGLPGSKNACEQGECGSCTVYLDGILVCACLVAAGQAQGRQIRTVEGLADGERLAPIQRAFLQAGAVQCGFCTPGLLVAAQDLLERSATPGDAEIREALAGNLCRCTGYEKILDAVRLAASERRRPRGAAGDRVPPSCPAARSSPWTPRAASTPTATWCCAAGGSPRSVPGRRRAACRTPGTSTPAAAWPRPGWSIPTTTCTSG